jgi:hypothetical protein
MISHIFTICCSSIRKLLLRDDAIDGSGNRKWRFCTRPVSSVDQKLSGSRVQVRERAGTALHPCAVRDHHTALRSQSPHFPVCATRSLHASSLMRITLRTRKSSLRRQGEASFECMQACLTLPSTVPAASAATAAKASPAASNVQSYNILQQVVLELEHLCFGRHCPTQTPSQKPPLQHVPNPHYFQISSHAQLHD